ncbi:acyltransferase family protein [Cohnella faecalis]|uniref:Acyltransferase 3 domain-containing protein n=1 Tax=Cohnella faecalis TaxID=2315694 RepID=A0A398CI94_9BACL|nr:acyltransferase [Cohnella faecalis]RIE02085.1 hypothetical protein D3H35_15095 [Cohnella faecalis]
MSSQKILTSQRILGYDLSRTFAVIFVFVAHIILAQWDNKYSTIFFTSFSPGVTMSLLGFVSACLLANSESVDNKFSHFLFRRITRIYLPMILCLTFAAILAKSLGTSIQSDHLIYHYLGAALFFDWLKVPNNASVGWGLWFVTAILIMYVLLPVLKLAFKHRNGRLHFILFYILCVTINIVSVPPESSFWNVAVSFGFGVYLASNGLLSKVLNLKLVWAVPLAILLLFICSLCSAGIIHFDIRKLLFPLYPIAFMPIFFSLASRISGLLEKSISKFSEISFEFYMLQFYFINGGFTKIFGGQFHLVWQIVIGFCAALLVSILLAEIGKRLRRAADNYFL